MFTALSSILVGYQNTVSGAYSAIIGGSCNTVTHNYAAVFGCNVASVADCHFHANNFMAQNMPVTPGVTGTFYSVFYAPLGGNVVMIA